MQPSTSWTAPDAVPVETRAQVGSPFEPARRYVLRLVFDTDLPELQTWGGCARLVGLWLLLVVGFALTPFYVLLRMPFQRGGWRFLATFVGLALAILLVAAFMLLSAGMAGLGSIK